MDAVVEWVDVRERLPEMIGYPVAAAVSGRYRAEPGEASGQDFWLVLPMYFTDRHITEMSLSQCELRRSPHPWLPGSLSFEVLAGVPVPVQRRRLR